MYFLLFTFLNFTKIEPLTSNDQTKQLSCRNLSLGLATKARVGKVAVQKKAWESHLMLLGVQKSVREWTLTFPSELPFWELEPQWTPKSLEGNYRGQNPLDGIVICIIKKLLKLRCLKWAHMTHLNIWITSYGQKKRRESNWQFDFRPLKVENQREFLVCKWCVTYRWKALNEGYNFVSNLNFVCRPSINMRSKSKL
jgi:hypothetical protein